MKLLIPAAIVFAILQLTTASPQMDAAISGRVTDPSGRPLAGMQVWLFRPEFNINARKVLWKTVATVRTDDRGEYRHFGIAPGRYYLGSGSVDPRMDPQSQASISNRPQLASVNTETLMYATSYYPGTEDSSAAVAVELKSGDERNGINLPLKKLQSFTIRARFVDRGGVRPPSARITVTAGLQYRDPVIGQVGGGGSRVSPDAQSGFEITNVPPGRYFVWVTLGIVSGPLPQFPIGPPTTPEEDAESLRQLQRFLSGGNAQLVRGLAAVDVVNSDVDGVVIMCISASPIAGQVKIEGDEWRSVPGRDQVRVVLRTPLYGAAPAGGSMPMPPMEIDADGVFGYPVILPSDDYLLELANLPEDVYLKDAHFGLTDVLGKSLAISAPTTDRLELGLSRKGGRLEGNVLNSARQREPNARVLLVSDPQPGRITLYKTATADAQGHYTIRGIPPGVYRVFAFESLSEPNESYYPEFVGTSLSGGVPLRIAEGSVALDLTKSPEP